ncbi:DUF726-domain-containing protein [Serendipita vermifera]|nr:DUF726-domain-containing protein [Serendipita vermifera]
MTTNEKDLVDLLSLEERRELVATITSIMDSMKGRLESTLESKTRRNSAPPVAKNPNLAEPSEPNSTNEDTALRTNQTDQAQEADEFEKELGVKLKRIKPTALRDFNNWQSKLFSRVMEAVYKPDSSTENASSKPRPSGSNMQNDDLKHWLPRKDSQLASKIPQQTSALVIHALLLLSLSLETYDTRSRILLLQLCDSLNIPISVFLQQEGATAHALIVSANAQKQTTLPTSNQLTADPYVQKRIHENENTRKWKIGLASVAGAVLVGVTGGLAAPLVAAGLGTLLGGIGLGGTVAASYLGAMAASAPLVGGLFGAYGGKMSGEMMKRYADEVEDFAFLPLRPKLESKLRVTICISGWLTKEDQVKAPWTIFNDFSNVYALRWEMQALLDLGSAMDTFVRQYAIGYIKKEIISRTVLASLWSALWPIGLLKFARIVDNPFNVAKVRAEKAGLVLADALIHRAQGKRPVSLVGYSLGARLIYSCLLSLAERDAFGLVENVVLMGAPVPSNTESWALMRAVVSGRLVNAYAGDDWILGFLYRTSAIQLGVAGLQEVEGVEGVENLNVGDIVDGHMDYARKVEQILGRVLDADLVQNIPKSH